MTDLKGRKQSKRAVNRESSKYKDNAFVDK